MMPARVARAARHLIVPFDHDPAVHRLTQIEGLLRLPVVAVVEDLLVWDERLGADLHHAGPAVGMGDPHRLDAVAEGGHERHPGSVCPTLMQAGHSRPTAGAKHGAEIPWM